MSKLPDYLIYKKTTESGEISVRKLEKKVGICVLEKAYEFPFSRECEQFLNKEEAQKLVKALTEYFHL